VIREQVVATVESTLDERGMQWHKEGPTSFMVSLPGAHRLRTQCRLIVGDHSVQIQAFVMRAPDENRERLWSWLLRRNARLYGVAFAIDAVGDVYLMGRVSFQAITPDEVDRLLGSVLSYADESFDSMLEIGFGSAIRREWAWRVSRGESLANLAAFAHFASPDSGPKGLVTGE
jgi:Putative bacterial sensory transduction regulator